MINQILDFCIRITGVFSLYLQSVCPERLLNFPFRGPDGGRRSSSIRPCAYLALQKRRRARSVGRRWPFHAYFKMQQRTTPTLSYLRRIPSSRIGENKSVLELGKAFCFV